MHYTKLRSTKALFTLVVFLAGCGSKGALFLPKEETSEQPPVTVEAVTTEEPSEDDKEDE